MFSFVTALSCAFEIRRSEVHILAVQCLREAASSPTRQRREDIDDVVRVLLDISVSWRPRCPRRRCSRWWRAWRNWGRGGCRLGSDVVPTQILDRRLGDPAQRKRRPIHFSFRWYSAGIVFLKFRFTVRPRHTVGVFDVNMLPSHLLVWRFLIFRKPNAS